MGQGLQVHRQQAGLFVEVPGRQEKEREAFSQWGNSKTVTGEFNPLDTNLAIAALRISPIRP